MGKVRAGVNVHSGDCSIYAMATIRQLAQQIRKLRGQKFALEKRESVIYRALQKKLCTGCVMGVRCWETDVMNCMWKVDRSSS